MAASWHDETGERWEEMKPSPLKDDGIKRGVDSSWDKPQDLHLRGIRKQWRSYLVKSKAIEAKKHERYFVSYTPPWTNKYLDVGMNYESAFNQIQQTIKNLIVSTSFLNSASMVSSIIGWWSILTATYSCWGKKREEKEHTSFPRHLARYTFPNDPSPNNKSLDISPWISSGRISGVRNCPELTMSFGVPGS